MTNPLTYHRKSNFEKKRQLRNMWSEDEHKKFEVALTEYGPKRLKEISNAISTRSVSQVRSHLQKHLIKLKKSGMVSATNELQENPEEAQEA